MTHMDSRADSLCLFSPTISCIIPLRLSMHPLKTIPHLWVVKRPVSRWSAMAASSSLEAFLSAAKIGCCPAQILFHHFLSQIIRIKMYYCILSFRCISWKNLEYFHSCFLIWTCFIKKPSRTHIQIMLCFVLQQRLSSQYMYIWLLMTKMIKTWRIYGSVSGSKAKCHVYTYTYFTSPSQT